MVANETVDESYNPWSVVHAVFTHLVDAGLHPVLGESGDPAPPARDLLRALGIEPDASGNREVTRAVRANLDEIRAAVFESPDASSQAETAITARDGSDDPDRRADP